jgi:hypothetical protein
MYWYKDFEVILFSEILFTLLVPYWKNRADSIITWVRRFWHIWRISRFTWDINGLKQKKIDLDERQLTIKNFKNLFNFNQLVTVQELIDLSNDFETIIEEKKWDEVYIKKAKIYHKIIVDLINI